jgi:hypothetical protein
MIEDVKDEHKDFKDDIKELWRNVKWENGKQRHLTE